MIIIIHYVSADCKDEKSVCFTCNIHLISFRLFYQFISFSLGGLTELDVVTSADVVNNSDNYLACHSLGQFKKA